MAVNQPPWPREWLMTDERLGGRLWEAIEALPAGAGIVFRHYSTPPNARIELAHRIANSCRERGLMLAIGHDVFLADSLNAALVHNPVGDPGVLPISRAAHSLDEASAAVRSAASLIFLSPLYPTRSHPEREPLSHDLARQIVAACPVAVIALGGMNRERFRELEPAGFYGWAGIDAWLGDQPRI